MGHKRRSADNVNVTKAFIETVARYAHQSQAEFQATTKLGLRNFENLRAGTTQRMDLASVFDACGADAINLDPMDAIDFGPFADCHADRNVQRLVKRIIDKRAAVAQRFGPHDVSVLLARFPEPWHEVIQSHLAFGTPSGKARPDDTGPPQAEPASPPVEESGRTETAGSDRPAVPVERAAPFASDTLASQSDYARPVLTDLASCPPDGLTSLPVPVVVVGTELAQNNAAVRKLRVRTGSRLVVVTTAVFGVSVSLYLWQWDNQSRDSSSTTVPLLNVNSPDLPGPNGQFMVEVEDNFDGQWYDPRIWNTPPHIAAHMGIVAEDGVVRLVNRGYLVSRNQFIPPYVVTFDWKWINHGLDPLYADILKVVLRTRGDPKPSWPHEASDGVVVEFNAWGGMATWQYPPDTYGKEWTPKGTIPMPADRWHTIVIADDGDQIRVFIHEKSSEAARQQQPILTIRVPEAEPSGHIAIYNRERLASIAHESLIDNFKVFRPAR